MLIQTITERVSEHLPLEQEDEDDGQESNISVLSGSVSQASGRKEHIDTDLSSPTPDKQILLVRGQGEDKLSSNEEVNTLVKDIHPSQKLLLQAAEGLDIEDLGVPISEELEEETELNEASDHNPPVQSLQRLNTISVQDREPIHTISVTVNRSRDSGSLINDKKVELENRKREFQEEMERQAKQRKEQHEGAGGGSSDSLDREGDKSQDSMEELFTEGAAGQPMFGTIPPNFYPGMGAGVPIFVMPGQPSSPEMMMLLQALRQARHEANYHDKETNGQQSDDTVPKLHTLLNLDDIDEHTPSVTPQTSHRSRSSQNGHDIGTSDSERIPKRREASPISLSDRSEASVHFKNENDEDEKKQGKRGILEVVSETIEPRLEYYDLSKTNISENEKRRFPRVNIAEPLKEKVKQAADSPRERSKERRSPGYRSRSLTPGSGYEEEQTMPKSILKDRSKSPLDSISPARRERLLRQSDDVMDRSPRSSLERSPRSSMERSPRSSVERGLTRSPRSSLERSPRTSTDRISGRDTETSPRYSPDRISGRDFSPRSPRRSPERSSGDRSPASPRTPRSPRSKSPLTDEITGDETSPGRASRDIDPNRRLVRVLNRELELLKLKMDVLEKSNLSDDTELKDIDSVTKRLREKVQERLSKSPGSKSPEVRTPRRSSRSPDYSRGRMFRRHAEDDLPSAIRSRSDSRPRSSFTTEKPEFSSSHKSRSLQDLSISEAADGKLSFSPTRRGKPISLGYSSPIRKVSEEIWGMNSADNVGYDPAKVEKWKKLVTKRHSSDQDVIELKQALASSLAENDILQAKLKNANSEIEEKMKKTNDVLNDCKTHLGKAQAENMELRTQLEKEKTRNDTLEARIREQDKQISSAKSHSDELESQLDQVTTLLQGMSRKDVPTLQSVAEERDNYKNVLANTQRDNTQIREVFDICLH